MNYQETRLMFNQLLCINFKVRLLKKDLTNTHLLLIILATPHKSKCVHVAGTNGKGLLPIC
jgi:folylpolyglutamate synthase/dihydropteroate synthase